MFPIYFSTRNLCTVVSLLSKHPQYSNFYFLADSLSIHKLILVKKFVFISKNPLRDCLFLPMQYSSYTVMKTFKHET